MSNERAMKRMLLPEDYLDDSESLRAYSYDASGCRASPLAVVRPRTEDQLRRILLHANQHGIKLVPRGGGTGMRGGVVLEKAIIVDMRHFTRLERFDRQLGTITVGAGASLFRLNQALKRLGHRVPIDVATPSTTIGGCAAVNNVGVESLAFGDWLELVVRVECFDALGRFNALKGVELGKVIGREGTTGIITKLQVKVLPLSKRTLEIIEVEDAAEAVVEAERLSRRQGLVGLEFFDSISSEVLGLGKEKHLVGIFDGFAGDFKDEIRVEELLERRRKLPQLLWDKGFTVPEQVNVESDRLESFIELCQKRKVCCYGHLGLGVLCGQLREPKERVNFWNDVVAIGCLPSAGGGYGRLCNAYVPDPIRKEIRVLKEERDYNNILNPGVLTPEKKITQPHIEEVSTAVRRAVFDEENDLFRATKDLRLSDRHIRFLLEGRISTPWLYRALPHPDSGLHSRVVSMREILVEQGMETRENREMVRKIRDGKNPFR